MRRRGVTFSVFLVMAAVTGASWSQEFMNIRLRPGEATVASLALTGSQLAPLLGLLVLTAAIATLVTAVARGSLRYLAAMACLLLTLGEIITLVVILTNPAVLARATMASITGIDDAVAQRDLIVDLSFSAWVVVALIGACFQTIVAARVLFLIRQWRESASRYERRGVRVQRSRVTHPRDATEVWDTLSDGQDPTSDQGD